MTDILEFLLLVGKLKHTVRTGWVLNGIKHPESVAGHMYRMSIMALILPDITKNSQQGIDCVRVMKMSIIHDLAEYKVGDITPYCGISREEKLRRETEAMQEICALVSSNLKEEIISLWNEYNEQQTIEANMTKDFDRFDMLLQAYEYESTQNVNLQQFYDNTKDLFKSDLVKKWLEDLMKKRDNLTN